MKPFPTATFLAALTTGLMAGLFFIFSVCIMKSLGRLAPEKGMAAMQSINVTIQNPLFFSVFFGASGLCLYALVRSVMNLQAPGGRYLLAGSVLYLVGVLLVTILANVPMNDALAAAKPASSEGVALWQSYLSNWTAWNHVRTVASMLSTACFTLALYRPGAL